MKRYTIVMGSIVHFDLPVDEIERAKKFYGELFDWKFEDLPGMDYSFIEVPHQLKTPLRGGMGKRGAPGQQITIYIDVPSVSEYVEKIKNAGGTIVQDKQLVPGWGALAVCLDTEGNTFGIWEENKEER